MKLLNKSSLVLLGGLFLLVACFLGSYLYFKNTPIGNPVAVIRDGYYFESYGKDNLIRLTAKDGFNIDPSKLYKLEALKQKALAGDIETAYLLGQIYQSLNRNPDDLSEAVKWYQLAADHGSAFAKNDLAIMYNHGLGVIKMPELAVKLFKEASDAGDDTATYNVGLHYELGEGVPVNYVTAAEYYQKSADRTRQFTTLSCGENDLGALYAKGLGVKQSDAEALKLFKRAAMKSLVIPLPKDTVVTKNFTIPNFAEVYAQYRLAVEKQTSLGALKLSGKELEKAKIVAEYYYQQCRV